MSNDTTIKIKEVSEWLRNNAPYSPRFLHLDLEDGRKITWELEPRTGAYNLKKEEHSLECPTCDTECKCLGELEDKNKTEIFFCYKCKAFFGIPDDGGLYTWKGDRGVEADFKGAKK